MGSCISLEEAIKKAIEIKRIKGGVGSRYVELSGSLQDPINRVMKESRDLIEKLSR